MSSPANYQIEPNDRPSSFYDNFLQNGNSHKSVETGEPITNNRKTKLDNNNHSQAYCLNTTVPQNIAAQNIAGKHTPTRNSLRHSRMIVLNRNGRVPTKYLPVMLRYNKLAKLLMWLILLLGIILCLLSVWFLIWTPNIKTNDNPYWSAVPVVLSGIVGLIFLCCCPKQYPGRKFNYCTESFKILSIFTSIVAIPVGFIVSLLAIIHLALLSSTTCVPFDHLNTSCICNMNDTNTSFILSNSYHYIDLSCYEVDNILNTLVLFSCITNALVSVLEILYLMMHWRSRSNYHNYIYSKVQSNDDNFTVFNAS